jgi:hypothetical protein
MKDELFRNVLYLEDLDNIKLYVEKGLTDNQFHILDDVIYRIKNVEILYYFIENKNILTYLMESLFMTLFIKKDLIGIKNIINKDITDKLISIIKDIINENNTEIVKYLLTIPEIEQKVKIKYFRK